MKAHTPCLIALVSSVSLISLAQQENGGEKKPGFTKPAAAAEGGNFKKPGVAEDGQKRGAGDGDGKKPGGEGDRGAQKTGMRDGGAKKPGAGEGDGGAKKAGGEGDSGKKKMGPRDGEGRKGSAETGMKKEGGEGGFKKPGAEGSGKPVKKGEPAASAETLVFRVLDKGATVEVAGEKVQRNALRAHLSEFLPQHAGAIVIVEGTADVPFGEMSGILDAVRDNGAKKAQMRVAEEPAK